MSYGVQRLDLLVVMRTGLVALELVMMVSVCVLDLGILW